MADNDIEVSLEPVEKTPEAEVTIDKAAPNMPVDPDESIEDLRQRLADAEQARREADQRAAEAARQVAAARGEVDNSNLQLVNSAIDQLTAQKEQLKVNYAAALAAQDYDTAAEINAALSENTQRLILLENGKTSLENQPKRAPEISEPVERMASSLSPRSAEWIRRNPDFARDPRLTRRMIAAHNLAETEGLVADTDAYFEHIENTLKIGRRPTTQVEPDADTYSAASAPTQRRNGPPPAAAPVSRNNGATRRYRLTPEEADAARASGLSNEEYALNKETLKKQGRLN